jgi:hypothetical protein
LTTNGNNERGGRALDENDYELDEIDDVDLQTRVHTLANLLQNGTVAGRFFRIKTALKIEENSFFRM